MDPAVIAVSVGDTPWVSWEEEIKVLCPEIRDHLTAMGIDTPELLVDCVNPEIAGPADSQYMITQDITWVDNMAKRSISQAEIGCGHRAKAKEFFHRAFACVDEQNRAVVAQHVAAPLVAPGAAGGPLGAENKGVAAVWGVHWKCG